jgi:hypothetical protein
MIFEKRILRRILYTRKMEEGERNYTMKSFITCTGHLKLM